MMPQENLNLDSMESCENHFINKHSTSLHEAGSCCVNSTDELEKENSCIKNSIFHVLIKIYAQLVVIVAFFAVFIEILHGHIPLFYIHVYIYLYLLSMSILIFVWSIAKRISHKCRKETMYWPCENHLIQTRYLEFGLVVFGLAAFSGTCLKSAADLISWTCTSSTNSALYVMNAVFIIFQFHFFCSKNLGYISFRFQNFAVFHLAATNAALWLYMVLWSSSADWQDAIHMKHDSSLSWSRKDLNITVHSVESEFSPLNNSLYLPKHGVHFTSNCWWHVVPESEIPPDILSVHLCLQSSSVGMVWKKASERLYPFAVQYYLIALFLLHVNWKNLTLKFRKYPSEILVKFQNIGCCFCLSKGFYLGCIYFIVSISIVVLHLIFSFENINIIVISMLSVVYASAVFSILIGLCQMKSASTTVKPLNQSSINYYYEIGVYFVYIYGVSNLFVGSLSQENYIHLLLVIEALLMILHAVSQYVFIKSVINSRQAINFLIMCNACMWLLESFVFCYKSRTDIHLAIYNVVSPIMNRIIVPCLAFYRFNSVLLLSNMSKYLSAEYH